MAFIQQSDLERYIDPHDLEQIIEGDSCVVTGAIDDGIEFGKEKLRQRYDVDFEYDQIGTARKRQLLKQTIAVVLYYICERIPTDVLPENRTISFEHAVEWFDQCASGKIMPDMKTLDDENQVGLAIRYGQGSPQNNNHY
ncbi:MAG: DUF1320 domain-containing protein [Deltaproteobacteria bacterium]|nr:DUF1320 domain-containing protein [Deltaproteobacteria bacterium]